MNDILTSKPKGRAINDKMLSELEVEVIDNETSIVSDGRKVFTNSKGEISGRIVGFKIDAVFKNNRFFHQDRGNGSCFLNVNRYAYLTKEKGEIAQTELALSLHDFGTKTNYYIKLPIGKVMILIRCRDTLPNVQLHDQLYRDALRNDISDLLLTSRFKSILNGENVAELLVKKRKRERKERKRIIQ